MPHWVMAAVFAPLGALAVWSFVNDLQTGVAVDRMWKFSAGSNPGGFAVILTGKALVAVFCFAEAAYGLGLSPDPVAFIKATMHLG